MIKEMDLDTADATLLMGGLQVKTPLAYRDLSLDALLCGADYRTVKKFLPNNNYAPVLYAPGRALTALLCFEYRDTGIEPYNEVALCIPLAKYGGHFFPSLLSALSDFSANKLHAHILHLPVNTDLSLKGGVEVFGYPKFLADIRFYSDGRRRTCEILDRDERFLLMRMSTDTRSGFAWQKSRFRFHTYPSKAGHTLKTTFDMEFDDLRVNPFPKRFSLELGNGEMSEAASLLLERPLFTLSVGRGRGLLHLPEVIHG